jgi:uncharacterized protein (DUF983 family)
MHETRCPKCGAQTLITGNALRREKPYCSVCGWNLERAKEYETKTLKQLPLAILWIGFVLGMMGLFSTPPKPGIIMFALIFVVVLSLSAFSSWKNLNAIKNSQPYVKAPENVAIPNTQLPDRAQIRITFERLLSLSKPRRISLKTSTRLLLVVFLIIISGITTGLVLSHRSSLPKGNAGNTLTDIAFFIVFAGISLSIVGGMIRSVVRDRRLLSNGEIAVGVIVGQKIVGGRSKTSRITYEFKDGAGKTYAGKSDDETRELYEDMQTLVFYDRDNPAENVTLVGATVKLEDS